MKKTTIKVYEDDARKFDILMSMLEIQKGKKLTQPKAFRILLNEVELKK